MIPDGLHSFYDRFARFYDVTYGWILRPRLRHAVRQLQLGDTTRVLDLGVGTGLTLEQYPRAGAIIGVDLSAGMLREAKRRVDARGLYHAHLLRADGLRLPFADGSFDAVFLGHVLTVVPDPEAVLAEVGRVAKPGARVVVVNRFRSENPFVAGVERRLNPMFHFLGWHADFDFERLARAPGLKLERRSKYVRGDLWETGVFSVTKSAAAASHGRSTRGAEVTGGAQPRA